MDDFPMRARLLLGLCLFLCALLVLRIGYAVVVEQPFTNSYALLAEAFLNGRLWVTDCFDHDCARFGDRTYVMFPPVPAVIAMPFVAIFGLGFNKFALIGVAFAAGALFLWWRMLHALMPQNRQQALWLLLAIGFATPLFFVTSRGHGVWEFAQTLAFFFVTAAIYFAQVRRNLVLAGAMIGLAFLCRQFSILYLPFLYVLALAPDQPLFKIGRREVLNGLWLALPAIVCVAGYLAYNLARFGALTSTGYEFMDLAGPDTDSRLAIRDFRALEHGLFSVKYVLFNLLYLFVQGFHVAFTGPDHLQIGILDEFGTGLLAASPFVLFAFFAPNRREIWVGLAVIASMAVPMLFYHSNGFIQSNVQRYTLEWLPIVFIILAKTLQLGRFETFGMFVTLGVALNVVAAALLAVT